MTEIIAIKSHTTLQALSIVVNIKQGYERRPPEYLKMTNFYRLFLRKKLSTIWRIVGLADFTEQSMNLPKHIRCQR